MDLFDRNDRKLPSQHEECVCDGKQGVFLNTRHMSWALSVILMLNFFVFMAGYFLGKKKILEHLNYKIDQESLTDHVCSSMYALYDSKLQPSSSSDNVEPEEETEVIEHEPDLDPAPDATVSAASEALIIPVNDSIPIKENSHEYYAQLVGFGSKHAAQQFINKLAQRDITAHMKQRTSKTSKGRIVYWYQVITETFAKKDDLVQLVEIIKQREKLHDVRIMTA